MIHGKPSSGKHPHTLHEIARLAGTSKSTVSRVLSNNPRISEKTRTRVMKIVEQQHYRPNLFARALAGGKTGLIGVISSNIGSGFYAEVIRGIDLVFNQLGKRLLVSFAHFESDYEALWKDIVLGGRIEGLIVVAPTSDFFKLNVDHEHIPIVIVAGTPPENQTKWKSVNRIGMDNGQAMDQLLLSLKELGCRSILHAAGWSNNSDAVERLNAFKQSSKKYRLKAHHKYFGIIPDDGRKSMTEYLSANKTLPDAIVCFNDSIALGILEAWHDINGQHSKPPFALTGWDDSPAAAAIGLTSVAIPCSELGEESARLLARLIDRDNTTAGTNRLIPLSLIKRISSNAPKAIRNRIT